MGKKLTKDQREGTRVICNLCRAMGFSNAEKKKIRAEVSRRGNDLFDAVHNLAYCLRHFGISESNVTRYIENIVARSIHYGDFDWKVKDV